MRTILKNIPQLLMACYLISCSILLAWIVINCGSEDGDTLEHVHSSWLIHQGKIPYKDFFQHHNPLLWYIGAPIVGMFPYSIKAVDAVNLLTVIITIITMIYIYKINKDFISNRIGGLIASAFYALPHDSLYNKDFKPDNYMSACLIIGIYYLFKYVKNKGLQNLVVSFMLFFTAFMFTQKSVLILFFMGAIVIYLVYKKDVSVSDFASSTILPILCFIAFLSYMWYEDILITYIRANYELNSHIPDVFYTRRFIYPNNELVIPILLSLYALATSVYKGNRYVRIIAILFIAEYIIRMYYFTPFVYYFSFLLAISSTLSGVAVAKILEKRHYLVWIFISYFVILGYNYANAYKRKITAGDSFKYGASGFVLARTNPCDYVVNGYRVGYNLFNKDLTHIWNLMGQIDVIASSIGLYPLDDLEHKIMTYRPKIIYGGNYYDTYREYRGAIGVYPVHIISKQLLQKMYISLNRDGIYMLKPEYQSKDCQYNPRTKTYEYKDFN